MAILAGQRIRALDYAGHAFASDPVNIPDPVPPEASVPIAPEPLFGVAFMAPSSGAVTVMYSGRLTVDPPAVRAFCTAQIRTGAVIGSGVEIETGAIDMAFEIGGSTDTADHTAAAGSAFYVFFGLTPGSLYHALWMCGTAVGGQSLGVHGRGLHVSPYQGV